MRLERPTPCNLFIDLMVPVEVEGPLLLCLLLWVPFARDTRFKAGFLFNLL